MQRFRFDVIPAAYLGRLKRSYERACYRAFQSGFMFYRGESFWCWYPMTIQGILTKISNVIDLFHYHRSLWLFLPDLASCLSLLTCPVGAPGFIFRFVLDQCKHVRDLCHIHQHGSLQGMHGGLRVILDMKKIFNIMNRKFVLRSFDIYRLDPILLGLINSWSIRHKYCILFKDLIGYAATCGGIKQGSKDIPFLWDPNMNSILLDL